MPTRRKFLKTSIAGLFAAGFRPAQAYELEPLGTTKTMWQELLDALEQNVLFRDDANFALRARVDNLRYMRQLPTAVAIIDTPEKCAFALNWCAANKIQFRIKGGGHNYAGFSTCNGLVLLTQGMNSASKDKHNNVTVGAGAINYQVYEFLSQHQLAMTHGRCPTVGLAGFVLGGGIGFDMRRYGLACDLLKSARIALPNGEIVTASSEQNSDLFWALRGGAGGNFEISTEFEFECFDVEQERAIIFERIFRAEKLETMAQLLEYLLTFCQNSTDNLGTRISVQYIKTPQTSGNPNYYQLDFLGQVAGPDWQFGWTLLAAIEGFAYQHNISIARPLDFVAGPKEYWEAQHLLSEAEALYFYQERSTFIKSTPDIAAIEEALDALRKRPDVRGPCDLRFFQTGGKINTHAPDATAFVHRDSNWIALVGYYWENGDDLHADLIQQGHAWQDTFYETILFGPSARFHGKGAYQNFPDVSLKNWGDAYYGANLQRLRDIQKKYDPDGLLTYPQAIGQTALNG